MCLPHVLAFDAAPLWLKSAVHGRYCQPPVSQSNRRRVSQMEESAQEHMTTAVVEKPALEGHTLSVYT